MSDLPLKLHLASIASMHLWGHRCDLDELSNIYRKSNYINDIYHALHRCIRIIKRGRGRQLNGRLSPGKPATRQRLPAERILWAIPLILQTYSAMLSAWKPA
jgi:hypothetical protein